MAPDIAQSVTAALALAGAVCTVMLWAGRRVVGEEIYKAMRREVQPLQQDVEVLRMAVFNHLAHGQQPVEGQIREVLGYGPRSK